MNSYRNVGVLIGQAIQPLSCSPSDRDIRMPPKRGTGILKSGNAGNSSKANKAVATVSPPDAEKPLFPVGYKYPSSLLNERSLPILMNFRPVLIPLNFVGVKRTDGQKRTSMS